MGTAYKKMTALAMLLIFGLTSVFGFLAIAQPAQAQLVTAVAADVPRTVDTVLSKVLQGLKIGVLNVASGAVSYALQKIAYDSAVWIASGGKGQGALVFSKGFSSYMADVGNDALGHGIDKLSKAFGRDFCKIGDPNIDLKLRQTLRLGIGITTPKDPTAKPNCSATQFFQNNLSEDAWKSRFDRTSKSVQNQFNEMLTFSADQSNLGVHLSSLDALSAIVSNAKSGAENDRKEGEGVKPLTTKVSGDIKLPAKSVGAELQGLSNSERVQQSAAQINTSISTGEFQLLPGALATFFLNTLAGTMLKNFQEKGILPFGACIGGAGGDVCQGGSDNASSYGALTQAGGRRAAEALFSDFLAVRTAAVDQYNILGELSNCPDTPGVYNCRADSGFTQALQQAGNGTPVTLKEAVDRGLIRGDWKLIPPIRVAENANKNCFQNSFCYSNIKALRQLRMVPLGFELAAEQSDPDKPWTLAEVMNGFNDCTFTRDATGKVTGVIYDPITKPFCHLIDPNWVLKAPATRCNALVYGPTLLSPDVPERNQECADLSTCVAYNKDGSCVNYAYCTRENNAWNFAATSCSSQYRTCKAFTDENGLSKAYVYRSLDTGFCSKDNVGCRAYSFNQDASGNWLAPSGPSAYGVNTGAFFNATVSTECSAQSAGCSAFRVAANQTVNLYLKQAPEYLKCYDANPATAQTDWPKSVADLTQLRPRAECTGYAAACIPDEVGCTYFTPSQANTGLSKIPAKFSAQDVCDARCVGYAAYREMPSNYSIGDDLAYIVPSSGQTCKVQEEGCSGFTNLSATAGGLEKVEYFSYLRTCSLPDPVKQKNFFTYEGSVSGFQLKTFTLVKDATGGPEYFVRTDADRAQYDSICNAALYKTGQASLDCREFNDEAGNTYYRLLAKTIPVSESCTPYRLNTTELYAASTLDATQCAARKGLFANGSCQLCLQGGEYRDGSCFYFGLPGGVPNTAGTTNVCTQAADSCRAFKGNAGNNIRVVFSDSFENQTAVSAWTGTNLAASPESVRVGGKSLNFSGAEAYRSFQSPNGQAYEVEFWAKGTGQALSISLRSVDGGTVKNFGTITAGDTWRSYKLGSVESFGSVSTTLRLVVSNPDGGAVFLDNVVVREVTQLIYLVKNTLKVDPVCDANLNDNLPGEALGCAAYTDEANNKLNLTGFSFLCREGAIGCTALLDSKNADGQPTPRLHNLYITGAGGSVVNLTVGTTTVSCQVTVGESGCYTNMTGRTLEEVKAVQPSAIVASTVYVPSPAPSSAPAYLVANQKATCNAVDLGCTYAGLQTPSPTGPKYDTVLVKNIPGSYQQNLCQQEALGCKAYSSVTGPIYFKDPALTGNKICAYRSGVLVNGVKRNGWFWKDVGVCSNDRTKACTINADCGTGATCSDLGNQPCYPDYQIDNSTFGLWSYGDKGKYKNFVGECPVEQDACTEFIDHADNDRAYYLIKDDKITQGTCDGKVSQKEGCALFDQSDIPNKYYSTRASYAASDAQQSKLVEPTLADTNNPGDANVIISVTRDRQCGEWLQCRSAHRVWDEKNARWKMVCDAIGRCNKAPENAEEDNISNCANWIEEDPVNAELPLTVETYVGRDTGWSGQDYSGMSISNMYPLESLSQVDALNSPDSSDWRLVRRIPCGDTNCALGATQFDDLCQTSGAPCGLRGSGMCLSGTCVQSPNGTTKDLLKNSPGQICRAYPEKDSPFPNSPTIQKAIRQFAGANICQESKKPSGDSALANACECDYTKVKYGDILTKYFNYAKPNTTDDEVVPGSKGRIPEGICLGGSQDGKVCSGDIDCYQVDPKTGKEADDGNGNRIKDGVCQKMKQNFQLVGWRGFCLEYDLSRTINGDQNQHPCLTWYPVDYLTGTQDINNQYVDAGYRPPSDTGGTGGAYYCLAGNHAGGDRPVATTYYPDSHIFKARTGPSPYSNTNHPFADRNRLILDTNDPSAERNGGKQGMRVSLQASGIEKQIKMQDIERIDLQVYAPDAEDPRQGAVFSIWPNNQINTKYYQGSYKTDNEKAGPGYAVTGHYLGQRNDFVLLYGSRVASDKESTYVSPDGKVCYPSANYGRVAGSWNVDTSACQDLQGNIFQALNSRIGGRFDCNTQGGCRPAGGNYDFAANGNIRPMSGTEGIWDPSFSLDSICKSYSPDLSLTDSQGNWHALRFKFDPNTGVFQGYYLAYCDQSSSGGHVEYDVTFVLKQWCPTVVDVKNDPLSDAQSTIAWTDRLWSNSKRPFTVPTLGYQYSIEQSPFGSLALNYFTNYGEQLNLTTFTGLPSCQNMSGVQSCNFAASITGNSPFKDSRFGAPFSCEGGYCVRTTNNSEVYTQASNVPRDTGKGLLSTLFARFTKFLNYSPASGTYVPTTNEVVDVTDVGSGAPRPPMILSVGPCDDTGKCIENTTSTGISVNDSSSGDVRVFTPSSRMFVRFFAFADANQMPLRHLEVDWGDGRIYPLKGLFRNARGYKQASCVAGSCKVEQIDDLSSCSSNADCASNKCVLQAAGSGVGRCIVVNSLNACKSDQDCTLVPSCVAKDKAPTFGTVSDLTCDNNYDQFEHVYQCARIPVSQGGNFHANPADCGDQRAFPNGCCIYVPKVRAIDNWGWCNGYCPGGSGGNGCYNAELKGGINECQLNPASGGSWTPYNGRVIVAPPSVRR